MKTAVYSPTRIVQTFVLTYVIGLLYQYERILGSNEVMSALLMVALCALAMLCYGLPGKAQYHYFVLLSVALLLSLFNINHAAGGLVDVQLFYVGGETNIMGRITERPTPIKRNGDSYWKIVVTVDWAKSMKSSAVMSRKASGNVLVYIPKESGTFVQRNDYVGIEGKVMPPYITFSQGAPDMRGRYYSSDIRGIVYDPSQIKLLKRESSFMMLIDTWRQTGELYVSKHLEPGLGSVLNALIYGAEYSVLPEEINDYFSRTGLIHILSVSGSHIALVLTLSFGCVYWLPCRKILKLLVVLSVVWIYAIMVGLSPPVLRSALMGSVGAVALNLGQTKDAVQSVVLVGFLQLCLSPLLIGDISFQFSYGAVLGILFFYKPLYRKINFLPKYVRAATALTISAQVLILPFQLYYFQLLSPSSLPANLLAAPLLEIAIALGLLAIWGKGLMGILSTVSGFQSIDVGGEYLFNPVLYLAGNILKVSLVLDFAVGSLPGGAIVMGAPLIFSTLRYYGGALSFYCMLIDYKKLKLLILLGVLICASIGEYIVRPSAEIHIFNDPRLKAVLYQPKFNWITPRSTETEAMLFIGNTSGYNGNRLTINKINDLKRFINFYGAHMQEMVYVINPFGFTEDEINEMNTILPAGKIIHLNSFQYEKKTEQGEVFGWCKDGTSLFGLRNETRLFLFGNGQINEKNLKLKDIKELYLDADVYLNTDMLQDVGVKRLCRSFGRNSEDIDPDSEDVLLIGKQKHHSFSL